MNQEVPSITGLSSEGSTSTNLLERVRAKDQNAWRNFVALYGPLVFYWAKKSGLPHDDMADVVQEVFRAVASGIDGFQKRKPTDSFRGWLHVVAQNKIRDHFRAHNRHAEHLPDGGTEALQRLQQIPEETGSYIEGIPKEEVAQEIQGPFLRRALELIRAEFEEHTWQAFWLCTVDDVLPAEAAQRLGIKVSAVYNAKSRVLKRLRTELGHELD